jgi:hypothetical protein
VFGDMGVVTIFPVPLHKIPTPVPEDWVHSLRRNTSVVQPKIGILRKKQEINKSGGHYQLGRHVRYPSTYRLGALFPIPQASSSQSEGMLGK